MANKGKTVTEQRQSIVDTTNRVLDRVYELVTPGTPVELAAKNIAPSLDLTHSLVEDRCQTLQELGILTRAIQFGRRRPNSTWQVGRFALWDLLVSKDEAQRRVDAWGERLMAGAVRTVASQKQADWKKSKQTQEVTMPRQKPQNGQVPALVDEVLAAAPKSERTDKLVAGANALVREESTKVTIAKGEAEETRAIAGPDAPSPMAALAPLRKADDATALIEAARQYAKRGDKMNEHIAALAKTAKDLGIEIDTAVIAAGIKLSRDERLENVGLVLPVIDDLTNRLGRANAQLNDYREKAKQAEALTVDNRRLRGRVEALISERVSNQQRSQA